MRTHRKHTALICWTDAAVLRELVCPQNLISARLEPITRGLRGGAGLDLMFARDGHVAGVPLIEIVPEMLAYRESSPFVWPQTVADAIGEDAAQALETLILPWIEAHALGRPLTTELMRLYGEAKERALFERAKSFGFLGAAPYEDVLRTAAPYAYAARFAQGARVGARDASGANGAAMLSRHARSVRFDLLDDERNALAATWFGIDAFGRVEGESDVAIHRAEDSIDAPVVVVLDDDSTGTVIHAAMPIPTDVMFSFDPQDAPAAAKFRVTSAAQRKLREPLLHGAQIATGGSSGRILVLVRNDWKRSDDADTDDAQSLAAKLHGEGFSVDLCAPSENPDTAAYDLVHAFGLTRANEFCESLRSARRAGVPTVFTAALDDVSAGGAWGAGMVRTLLRLAYDETALQDHLAMLAARRLEAPGLNAQRQELFAGYDSSVREALALSDIVLSSGPSEEALLRGFGHTGPIEQVSAYLRVNDADAADEHVGSWDYVLVHAPIEARCNQLPLVRAAVLTGTTLVLAGPVVEPDYYQALRDFANERVIFVPEAADAQLEALYRGARVYVDVAWYRFGLGRVARAVSRGCAVVLSSSAHAADLPPQGIRTADPASAGEISVALQAAWDQTPAKPHAFETRSALMATAAAYHRVLSSRTPA